MHLDQVKTVVARSGVKFQYWTSAPSPAMASVCDIFYQYSGITTTALLLLEKYWRTVEGGLERRLCSFYNKTLLENTKLFPSKKGSFEVWNHHSMLPSPHNLIIV